EQRGSMRRPAAIPIASCGASSTATRSPSPATAEEESRAAIEDSSASDEFGTLCSSHTRTLTTNAQTDPGEFLPAAGDRVAVEGARTALGLPREHPMPSSGKS